MKLGSTLVDVAQRVDHLRRHARDFLARPAQIRLSASSTAPSLVLDDGTGALSFGIGDLVHDQLADYAGIPMPYYKRMLTEAPDLLAANANTWLSKSDGRRLVRTALNEEEQPVARAFLSDRYRPLDHFQLMEAVLPLLHENGIRIESCALTEKRLYLKAVSERIIGEVRVGETVMAGIIISNSEVGFGALGIQPLIYTLRCTNGMVVEDSSLRQHHVGRRHGDPGDGDIRHLLSDETRTADDRAFFLKVRDVAKAALDEGAFRRQLDRLKAAAGAPIANPALDLVVEVTAKRFGLSEGEGAGVLAHLIRGGDLSQWGLVSAVTRFSQDVADYDRATELERIGGRLVELPKADWARLAAPSEN
jgi:Domain of unknown function (DUF932)